MSSGGDRDARFMRLALAAGARHLGLAWPNPSVGAVVVREDGDGPLVVGVGATQAGGRPHAEREALARAGAAARGATLYVTLEPCSHHGRTPPCVDAILEAGIARVVSGLTDPNPLVAGSGHARLAAAGVAVTTGVLAREAARAHRGHVARVRLGRPAVTLKLARTRDGFAAGPSGGPRLLITGEAANARTHLLRAHADAIAVGVGTVLADDPGLDVRLPGLAARSPVRVVLDGALRTPPTARLLAREGPRGGARAIILAAPDAPIARETALRAAGAEIVRVATGPDGRLDLGAALAALGAIGLTRLLVEGGPTLADALAAADLIDEAWLLTGPDAIGAGLSALGPALAGRLAAFAHVAETAYGVDRADHHERPPEV